MATEVARGQSARTTDADFEEYFLAPFLANHLERQVFQGLELELELDDDGMRTHPTTRMKECRSRSVFFNSISMASACLKSMSMTSASI